MLEQFRKEQEDTKLRFAAAEAKTAAVAEDLAANTAMIQEVMGAVETLEASTTTRISGLEAAIGDLSKFIRGMVDDKAPH